MRESFFEEYGCLFAVFAAYHLEGHFEIVSGFDRFRRLLLREIFFKSAKMSPSHWLPIRESFLQTLYNSRIFVLLNEVIKYFFDFVAGFSLFRRLPIEGVNWIAVI